AAQYMRNTFSKIRSTFRQCIDISQALDEHHNTISHIRKALWAPLGKRSLLSISLLMMVFPP
ncbi:hypothetical protein DY723_25920, partial [Salmonella enterica]|nr:hypothetical protein [Salmonella enterica]